MFSTTNKIILLLALIALLLVEVICKCNGRCVPPAKCSANYGESNVFDLRIGVDDDIKSDCGHYLEVCCQEKDIINDTDSSEKPSQLKGFQSCGQRNLDGVGFRIAHASQGETEFGEFPWMVALLDVKGQANGDDGGEIGGRYFCGGSLIEPNVVATVAHCVSKKKEADLIVRAGEWDSKTTNEMLPFQERRVERITIHENYNPALLHNDIALLFLEEPFHPDEHIQLLCLPPQDKSFEHQENCTVTGWGKERFDSPSYQAILKKINRPVISHSECQTALRLTRLGRNFNLHNSFICAGVAEGVDTCTGDGGSPLVCPSVEDGNRYQLAGMVAWGIGCGREGIAGVYVKGSLFYDWIFRTTELYGLEKESSEMKIKRL